MEADVGVYAKVNNAIKSRDDAEGLWRAIRSGGITNMGTDHVCWTVEEKESGGGKHDNIWNALPGISGGTEHWLPVMLTGVAEGRLSLSDVVRVTSTANSRLFGLYPRKGTIELGSDADVVVVDMERDVTVKASEFYRSPAATGWSLYEGRTFHGMPVMTIARGQVLVEDGEVVGTAQGRYVPRRPRASAAR
jgi:dihydroorotase-like cyclic amidohydrolase